MKFLKFLASSLCLVAMATSFQSCSDDDDKDSVDVRNGIYLSFAGGYNQLTDGTDNVLTVNIDLSSTIAAPLTLDIAVANDPNGYVELVGTPVTIAAGARTASFQVKSANKMAATDVQSMNFVINGLDESKFEIKENATFFLYPYNHVPELTPEQTELISRILTTYGIDLTPWMGEVALTGTLEFPGNDYITALNEPTTIDLEGKTGFTLGSNATTDEPSLCMATNPMGMSDYLLHTFRQLTVEDNEYFCNEFNELNLALMNKINWNKVSKELFIVKLDNIRLTNIDKDAKTADLEFVVEEPWYMKDLNGNNIYSEMMGDDLVYNYSYSHIPFEYSYTAWNRLLKLYEQNDPEVTEWINYTSMLPAPATKLGTMDAIVDPADLEEDTESLYVQPTGKIDFSAGTMTFEFPFDMENQNGYSRVKVTYTLAK